MISFYFSQMDRIKGRSEVEKIVRNEEENL